MDNFREEVVSRRNGKVIYTIAYIMTFITMIVSGIFALLYLSSIMSGMITIPSIIVFVIAAAITFLIWRYKDNLRTEYEYTLTNGEMDFAKVTGNTRRKHLLSLSLKNVEQGGTVESDAYVRISSGPNVKKADYTLNADASIYYLYYLRDGVRNIVLFEPSEKMVELIRIYKKDFIIG